MDHRLQIEHLRADSATLLAACSSDPNAEVPSCPGWRRHDLLAHVGGVHSWARAQLEIGNGERVKMSAVERPPEGPVLPGWFEAGAGSLVAALEVMDIEATWPTWAGPQPGSFFPRRMAQETAVHRWDVVPEPIDAGPAVDGIDELLELFVARLPAERFGAVTGTIHLHATDRGLDDSGEWLVEFDDQGITFHKGHARGDAALRGTASDLLLWVWNRVTLGDRFEVFGNQDLLRFWTETVVF